MKIIYRFDNGDRAEVEVSNAVGEVILDSRREENNGDRRERYHRAGSLDALKEKGREPSAEDEWARPDEGYMLVDEFLQTLTPTQRQRVVMRMGGYTCVEIAEIEGVGWQRISKSMKQAAKKYKKF